MCVFLLLQRSRAHISYPLCVSSNLILAVVLKLWSWWDLCSLCFLGLSMGALDEGHFNIELENGAKLGGCVELGFEEQPETLPIGDAVRVLLQGLGEDVNREGIRKTPLRVAKALLEGTRGYRQKVKDIVHGALFPEAGLESGGGHGGGAGGMVVVRDLDLFSYCESCLIPFQVKCHVGYVPSGHRVVGLSKLSRVTDIFAKRLQDPQRLADEVCKALQHGIRAAGVAVVLQCSHIHIPNFESKMLDTSHQGWTKILVTSRSGVYEDESASDWAEFVCHLRFRGIKMVDACANGSLHWCPLQSLKVGTANSAMVHAVVSIIRALGEDPLRRELVGTPARFVTWLMNFKCSNLEMKPNGFARSHFIKANGNISHEEDLSTELNLSFWSQCEHHLLPFHGVVHIGYYQAGVIYPIDRSFLQQIVHFYGLKLQVQERLTRQIAETVSLHLGEDVMVVVEASHTCMMSRGIEKFGSNTVTVAVLGKFASNPASRVKFLQSIPNSCQTAD